MATNLTIDLKQLGITWSQNTDYRVVLEEGVVKETGNNRSPNPETNILEFTNAGTTDPVISNMIDRSYVANKENLIFTNNTPSIVEFDVNNTSYTITFSSTVGKFSFSSIVAPVTTLTYTGTRSEINNIFSTIKFYPNAGSTANGTLTYTQQKTGYSVQNFVVNLTGTTGSFVPKLYSIMESSSFVPTNEDVLYSTGNQLLIIGGGGGGGLNGGGGGGGQVITANNISLTHTSYSILIGSGGSTGAIAHTGPGESGASGSNGQSTVAFGYTAPGGLGGEGYLKYESYPLDYPSQPNVYRYSRNGGNSALSGGTYSGVIFTNNPSTWNRGGGGGGAISSGSNGPSGTGGSGIISSITGDSIEYGVGGGGWIIGQGGDIPEGNVNSSGTNGRGTGCGADDVTGNTGGSGQVILKLT